MITEEQFKTCAKAYFPEGIVKGFLDPRWIKKDDGNTR